MYISRKPDKKPKTKKALTLSRVEKKFKTRAFAPAIFFSPATRKKAITKIRSWWRKCDLQRVLKGGDCISIGSSPSSSSSLSLSSFVFVHSWGTGFWFRVFKFFGVSFFLVFDFPFFGLTNFWFPFSDFQLSVFDFQIFEFDYSVSNFLFQHFDFLNFDFVFLFTQFRHNCF